METGKAIRFNWGHILAFAVFWSYGYAASIASTSFRNQVLVAGALLSIFVFFLRMAEKSPAFEDVFVFTKFDAAVFVSYFTLLAVVAFPDLFHSLQGDQLFHAQHSQVHAAKLIRLLSGRTELLNDWRYASLIIAINGSLLAVAGGAFYFLRKKRTLFYTTLIAAFIGLRFSTELLGGNWDGHPAFRLFPLWLSGTVLGLTDFSFRFPQFLGLVAAAFALERILRRNFPRVISWLLGLSFATIPLTLHVATLVEFSVWSLLSSTLVLAFIFSESEQDKSENVWVRLFSLVTLATLIRLPSFVAFIPLGILAVWRLKAVRPLLVSISPVLAVFPTLLRSFIFGTPATHSTDQLAPLLKVLNAVREGIAYQAAENSLMFPFLFLLPLAFLPLGKSRWAPWLNLLFFGVAFVMFFSIDRELWGIGRYQSEYLVPFAFIGLIQVVFFLFRFHKAKMWVAALLVGLISYNLVMYKRLPELNLPVDVRKTKSSVETKVLSELVYDYRDVFRAVKESGYSGHTFLAGVGYGNFSQVINGYNVKDWVAEFGLMNWVFDKKASRGLRLFSDFSAEDLTANKKIQMILVSDYVGPHGDVSLTPNLLKSGWEVWRTFKNEKYGSTVVALRRQLNSR